MEGEDEWYEGFWDFAEFLREILVGTLQQVESIPLVRERED
jgi:hypothetical protein